MSIRKEEFIDDSEKTTKRCFTCKKLYNDPKKHFYSNNRSKDGLSYYCKACTGKWHKKNDTEFVVVEGATKVCSVCKTKHPANTDYFNRNRRTVDGLSYTCKACKIDNNRKYALSSKYNITPEMYNEMFILQEEKCLICDKKSERELCVDHDHDTGEIRGLLCNNCNTAIGLLGDDYQRIINAAYYLDNYNMKKREDD